MDNDSKTTGGNIDQSLQQIRSAKSRPEAIACCETALQALQESSSGDVTGGVTGAEELLVKHNAIKDYLHDLKAMKDEDYTPDVWQA